MGTPHPPLDFAGITSELISGFCGQNSTFSHNFCILYQILCVNLKMNVAMKRASNSKREL